LSSSFVLGIGLGYLPEASFIGLVTVAVAAPALVGAFRNADVVERLRPSLVLNVLITVLTPVLVAIGLFVGK
jgi:1,4-dihydroxy-2-naphthoate octaprenyltransferase